MPVPTSLPRADEHASDIERLAAAAAAVDGVAPFNDDTMLNLGERSLHAVVADDGSLAAAALARPIDGGLEAELVVHPSLRRNGIGGALVSSLRSSIADDDDLVLWAHGDLAGAQALAASNGMRVTRSLYKLGREVLADDAQPFEYPDAVEISAFRPGIDDGDFLELNARVFRDHPEQGALDQDGLDARMQQDWFAADAFLLARDRASGALIGYNWLKIADGEGEIYVIGVADEAAGRGLGRALMRAGLARIHASGVPRTTLYVEGDNDRALALYRSLGYGEDSHDVQYRG